MSDNFHDIPGRLRVRIACIRANPSMGIPIRELLEGLPGTITVSIRTTTGSVIINYDPQVLDPNRILSTLAAKRFIDPDKLSKINSQLEAVLYRTLEAVLKAVLSRAVSKALSGSSLSAISSIL